MKGERQEMVMGNFATSLEPALSDSDVVRCIQVPALVMYRRLRTEVEQMSGRVDNGAMLRQG